MQTPWEMFSRGPGGRPAGDTITFGNVAGSIASGGGGGGGAKLGGAASRSCLVGCVRGIDRSLK